MRLPPGLPLLLLWSALAATLAGQERRSGTRIVVNEGAGAVRFLDAGGKTMRTLRFRSQAAELRTPRGWYESVFVRGGVVADLYRVKGHPQSEGVTIGRGIYGPDGRLLADGTTLGNGLALQVSPATGRVLLLPGTTMGILGTRWSGRWLVRDLQGRTLAGGSLHLGGALERLPGHPVELLGDAAGKRGVVLRGSRFWRLHFATLGVRQGVLPRPDRNEFYRGARVSGDWLVVTYGRLGSATLRTQRTPL